MESKALTYQEFIELAKENYTKGGMVFYECWDKGAFDYFCKEFGKITKKKALQMFKRGY
jgi:hypothetical protein